MNPRTRFSTPLAPLLCPIFLSLTFTFLAHPSAAQDESVEQLCKTLLSETHKKQPYEQNEREVALHKLARRDSVPAVKCLVQALTDPFQHIRQEAVYWMQEEVQSASVIKWLSNKGLQLRHPAARKNVVRTLSRLADPSMIGNLKPLAEDGGPALQRAVAEAVRRIAPQRVPGYLLQLAASNNEQVAAEAIRTMGTIPDPRVSSYLRNNIRSLSGRPLAEATLALGRHAPDGCVQVLKTLLNHDSWQVRVMALRGFLALEQEQTNSSFQQTFKAARTAFKDGNWHVRAAAVDVLARTWTRDAIPVLLDGFEQANGRLRLDFMRALQTMTGEDLKWNPLNWKSWWSQHKEDLELGDQPENWRAGVAMTGKEKEQQNTDSFFGVPMVSNRVMFVMDFSGGMSSEVESGEYEGQTKIEIAKQELGNTIKKLNKKKRFNVLVHQYRSTFPPETRILSPFKKGRALVPARPQAQAAAYRWVSKLKASGWGAFYEAFRAATRSPAVDTIVFLSDGKPTRGKFAGTTAVMDDRFFEQLQEMNRYRQVMIHTVLTGAKAGGTDADYLKRIADLTGGIFQKF